MKNTTQKKKKKKEQILHMLAINHQTQTKARVSTAAGVPCRKERWPETSENAMARWHPLTAPRTLGGGSRCVKRNEKRTGGKNTGHVFPGSYGSSEAARITGWS